jgi:hypothetical protein
VAVQVYATLAELSVQVGSDRVTDDVQLELALSTGSQIVTTICGRRFWQDDTVSARTFSVNHPVWAWVDDISTTIGLIVETDTSDDGTFGTTWAASDYELGPANGEVGGLTGFPYSKITAVGSYTFPTFTRRATCLRVTARWGWAAVPDPVKSATLIAAEEVWRMKDAPFGVAGINALDGALMRVRQNPFVASLLEPYRIGGVVLA